MKKIIALLFIILLVYSTGYCGDGDGDARPFRRVYFGVSFTPAVSYRYLVNNYVAPGSTSSSNQTDITNANKNSSPEFGANADFKVGVNLTRWLAVESGVGYALYRYKGTETIDPTLPAGVVAYNKFKQTYNYMTVPLGLRFSMGHRRVRGIIAAGVDFDFLIKEKLVETDTYAQPEVTTTTVETKNFHTFNLSPYFGIGVDCYATPGFVIRLMPQAQMQALKNMNDPVSEYLWNVGFNVSFLFGL